MAPEATVLLNRNIKRGFVGGLVTALCCFTPALVWFLGLVGLSALAGYLDYLLLPLLALFVVLLLVGIFQAGSRTQ